MRINGSLARVALKQLEKDGVIRLISAHASQLIYTRATKAEDEVAVVAEAPAKKSAKKTNDEE